MFSFIFSKRFFIHFLAATVFVGAMVWALFQFIADYTLHGQTISVPELEGLSIAEVEELLTPKELRYHILDSIYIEDAIGGTVLEQDPQTDDLVKKNRTIYITTSKVVPSKVTIPNVVDMSLRLAVEKLKSYGLNVKIQQRPSECVNCVLQQEINGKAVQNNQKTEKGTTVQLTVGIGTSNEKVMVPYLLGLTQKEAEEKTMKTLLNIGFMDYVGCNCLTKEDSLNAQIYRQNPAKSEDNAISIGASIDVYFTCDSSRIPITVTDSLTNDTLN